LATQRRFRPIFLTTATTSLGLMPLIFETSTTAQFMIPMAISLAVGILFASILILFIVPTLLVIKEGSNQAYASDQLQDSAEAKTVRIS
jgi:multidrug efflux pump subunit AcrB